MILVTGGTGLVGSHLLYHLIQKNDRIRAIYRSEESLQKVRKVFSYYTSEVEASFSKIDWQQADITDVPAMIPALKEFLKSIIVLLLFLSIRKIIAKCEK